MRHASQRARRVGNDRNDSPSDDDWNATEAGVRIRPQAFRGSYRETSVVEAMISRLDARVAPHVPCYSQRNAGAI
jgi:hypothetical protein